MSEATLILPNMRGGCATIDGKVHTLFRVTSRRPRPMARPVDATSRAVSTGSPDARSNTPLKDRI